MIFRQLFDQSTSTFTYLLGDERSRKAVLIDSVFEQHLRDRALLSELRLELCACVETHVHADHVTGAWLMKEAVRCEIHVAAAAGTTGADRELNEGDVIAFGASELRVLATPGHTPGCISLVNEEMGAVFTGDALLIRGAGRTDFQEGNAAVLFHSVREKLFSLPDSTRVYPGHDYSGRTCTTVAEEKEFNPRLGEQVREEDFAAYMENMRLPHPKRLDYAVPANSLCGRPSEDSELPQRPTWGPVSRSFAGVWQIDGEWAHAHRSELTFLDVRETEELEGGGIGRIEASRHVPLSELRERLSDVPLGKPVVVVCPSGARSSLAAGILEKAEVPQVANLRSGLIEWRALGFPLTHEPTE